jgi:hypothetical protein
MSAWLLASHLETLGAARRWVMLAIALGGALVLVGAGAAIARPSAAHPEPSMLGYAFDVETSRAWFVTPREFVRPGSWTAGVVDRPRASWCLACLHAPTHHRNGSRVRLPASHVLWLRPLSL